LTRSGKGKTNITSKGGSGTYFRRVDVGGGGDRTTWKTSNCPHWRGQPLSIPSIFKSGRSRPRTLVGSRKHKNGAFFTEGQGEKRFMCAGQPTALIFHKLGHTVNGLGRLRHYRIKARKKVGSGASVAHSCPDQAGESWPESEKRSHTGVTWGPKRGGLGPAWEPERTRPVPPKSRGVWSPFWWSQEGAGNFEAKHCPAAF